MCTSAIVTPPVFGRRGSKAVYTCIWNCSSKDVKELRRVVNAAIVVCKAVIT